MWKRRSSTVCEVNALCSTFLPCQSPRTQAIHAWWNQDTTWPESEPCSALPADTSSFNLRTLGLLDTAKASIKCGYSPCPPNICTHYLCSAHYNPPEGVKRDNPSRTPSVDDVKCTHTLYAFYGEKQSVICMSVCTAMETN